MGWFTGTSTGRVYEVGKLYAMAGDTYRANRNGSFTNLRSGVVLDGSSQSERVTWGGGPSSAASRSSGQASGGAVSASAGNGPGAASSMGQVTGEAGTGPGQMVVRPGAGYGTGPASQIVLRSFPWQVGPLAPKDKPMERVGNGSALDAEGGISDLGWVHTTTGIRPVPSEQMKERMEDDFIETGFFHMRNSVSWQLGLSKPPYPSYAGPDLVWNSFANEWQPNKGRVQWNNGSPVFSKKSYVDPLDFNEPPDYSKYREMF